MPRSKADRLTDLVLAVFRLNGALSDWGDEFASSEGLSTARWQMLGAVALAGRPLAAPQVAARMGMTRQGAQRQLHLLVEAGLMEARSNPMHKRSPLYDLTPHGRDVFASIDARWKEHVSHASSPFRGSDLEAAAKLLVALIDTYSVARKDNEHEA